MLSEPEKEAKDAGKHARKADLKAAKGEARDERPRYLTPSEVLEIMRRMWARNAGILSLLFAADRSIPVRSCLEEISVIRA